jgi:hypothetical protein
MRQLVAALAMLLSVAAAHAQSDHLACFKIRDTQPRVTYTADIAGLVLEPGCVVRVPAAMACVPATKSNVTPAPPGSGGTAGDVVVERRHDHPLLRGELENRLLGPREVAAEVAAYVFLPAARSDGNGRAAIEPARGQLRDGSAERLQPVNGRPSDPLRLPGDTAYISR